MMKVCTSITRFNTGEISPLLSGRVDTEEYKGSCSVLENFIPSVQGPVTRRGGTRFVAQAKYADKKARLVGFQFSVEQPYLLEFGDKYIRYFFQRERIVNEDLTPIETQSLYLEEDLADLSFAQSGDLLYIAHPKYPLCRLVRYSNIDWRLENVNFIDGPYLPLNTGDTSIQSNSKAGIVTLTASSNIFKQTDVGRCVRMMHSYTPNVKWGVCIISGFVNEKSVTAAILTDYPLFDVSPTKSWRLGAFSGTTGFPATVTFFEQRLILAKSNSVYGSKTGVYDDFGPTNTDGTVTADLGFGYELSSEQINEICWLSSGRVLAIGTVGADFTLATEGGDGVLPFSVRVIRHSTYGSEAVSPIKISNTTLFVQRYGRKLRAFTYDSITDGYVAKDLTTFAPHITESSIKQMTLQQEPQPIIWIVLKNGSLVGLTYDNEENVKGWHRHVFKDAFIESIQTLPDKDGLREDLFLMVKRNINENQVCYIEVMEQGLNFDATHTKDAFFVDCGLTYRGEKVQTVSGLEHLETEFVSILADGAVQPERQVINGKITLDSKASVVHIGLGFRSVLQPMPLSLESSDISNGTKKRISGLIVKLFKSLGFLIGNEGKTERQVFRNSNDLMDSPPALFTGDKKIAFTGSWDDTSIVRIEQDQPLPLTITGLFPIINVSKL